MLNFLARTPVITLAGIAFLVIGFGFSLYLPHTGEPILDILANPADVSARLEAMSPEAKAAHAEMTLWLDMPYPISYTILFAGLALRAFPKGQWWIVAPAFLGGGFDVLENIVQLMALTGNEGLLGWKAVLTPVKFLFFVSAALLALVSLIVMGIRAFRGRKETNND